MSRRGLQGFARLEVVSIVDVTNSQPHPAHFDDRILFELDASLALDRAAWTLLDHAVVVLDHEPELFLRQREHRGQVDLMTVIEPVALFLADYFRQSLLVLAQIGIGPHR